MSARVAWVASWLLLFFAQSAPAQLPERLASRLPTREWQVDGVKRESLVFAPDGAKQTTSPVIFAFHGHGGTAPHAARTFGYQRLWPEAIVVYMQGLNTPGKLTDPEGKKSGWQSDLGEQADRDLKFFDAVLASLKQDYKVDENRIYATGHSNGGGFTYNLWAARGEVFAAVAPSAAVPARLAREKLTPKPVLHVAGENDPLVKYAWQKLAMDLVRRVNQCAGDGKPSGEHLTRYESTSGFPVVTYITDGKHEFPSGAPPAIVKFFREHSRQSTSKPATPQPATATTPDSKQP